MDQFLHVGIDDTDSPRRGCTTYIAALLVDKFCQMGLNFTDYPHLVRLNPNVPWKTRGNGAVCLRVNGSKEAIEEVQDVTIEIVENESDLEYRGTDPGVVFLYEREVPSKIQDFAQRTITDIVSKKEALVLIKEFKAEAFAFKEGRGVVGALASIGEQLQGDHTYEYITYRIPRERGKPRRVDDESVLDMDVKLGGLTFNNVDLENKRTLITPRGPDPVLFGVRGETARAVREAGGMIKAAEEVERWVIFKTNQGTDAHLRRVENIRQVQPHRPVIVTGTVTRRPVTVPVRHVIFSIEDDTGNIDCAAYEPTKKFRNIIRKLIPGDLAELYGGVRSASAGHPMTINLEKIDVIRLSPKVVFRSPKCPECGKTMTSMGRKKGYKCRKCGFRDSEARRQATEVDRNLSTGLYLPPLSAHRHLTKPLSRYGREKSAFTSEMIEEWHHP
jgi:tRNA(Ile2)-agmatinylcytidine synthase